MTMLGTFDCEEDPCGDELNVLVTTSYRRTRSETYTPDDIIYGAVYIGNENANKVIDFTKEDLTYICKQVGKPKNSKMTSRYIAYLIYIYMENTTEPISEEEAAKQQQRVAELRRYNRDYYHAHKKASECERCKKTFSSVNALRRHQAKNLKCKLLQATETKEKFMLSG